MIDLDYIDTMDTCDVCGAEFLQDTSKDDSVCSECRSHMRECDCCCEWHERGEFRTLEGEKVCSECYEENKARVYVSDGGTKPDPCDEDED